MGVWDAHLFTPRYLARSAARYVGLPVGQVRYWNRVGARGPSTAIRDMARQGGQDIARPPTRPQLVSYPELVELAVTADFVRAGLSLSRIRATQEHLTHRLGTPYPFASRQFSLEGPLMIVGIPSEILERCRLDRLLVPDERGRLVWSPTVRDRYEQFEYDSGGPGRSDALPIRWRPRGHSSPVVVDPAIAFGQPTVGGIPTGVLADRFRADGDLALIVDDYQLEEDVVREALRFEGLPA